MTAAQAVTAVKVVAVGAGLGLVVFVGRGCSDNMADRRDAELACLRAGYPEARRPLGTHEYFCVGRADGTDRVVPLAEVAR